MQQQPTNLPGQWFLKPTTANPVFESHIPELNGLFTLRSLNLSRDGDLVYDWVNQAYAKKFWQLSGARSLMETTYQGLLEHPQAHSFIGCLNEVPICLLDAYAVHTDELTGHVAAGPHDGGVHLLMCPPRQMQRGWSYYCLKKFQQHYFSFQQPMHLFAEPDQENIPANKLAMDTGFRFLRSIQLSYKVANLYQLAREDFKTV